MKKAVRYIVLGILLLAALTVCSAAVLKVFAVLLKTEFENIWYSGFKVALIAFVLLLTGHYFDKKRGASTPSDVEKS